MVLLGPDWVWRWRSSAVTAAAWSVLRAPPCARGPAVDWTGVPSRAPFAYSIPWGQRGGVDWALVSVSRGKRGPDARILGVSPGNPGPGSRREMLGGLGGGGPVAPGRPPLYFFSFLPDFFLLPLPPAGALPSRLPAALVSVALLPGM